MLTKLIINNEIIYFDKNDKYKTVSAGLFSFNPFTVDHSSERKILAAILSKSNQYYEKEQEFNIYCQDLYDSNVTFKSSRTGRTTLFNGIVNFINPLYVCEGKELLFNILNLLITNYTKPSITKEKVELEKNILINSINNIYNNKYQYTYNNFISKMFEGELIANQTYGTIEQVKNVTVESVNDAYLEVLQYPRFFYITGDVDISLIEEFFNNVNLPKVNNDLSIVEFIDYETKEVLKVKEITETQLISQSVLCLGYRSDIRINSDLHYPMLLFNGMLGGSSYSSLFKIIREEHSLCYNVSSEYDSRKGFITIILGIDKSKYDEVILLINNIIKDYQNKIIDSDNLELTKMSFINNLIKQEDNVNKSLYEVYDEISNIKTKSLLEKMDLFNKVTMDDIHKVSKMIKLDTIYFLKGELDE